jgi:hypothetical protein
MQFTKYTGTVTGQVGSLITALDAILVTGQSWTKEFTGTNKAVYRAPSGNRFYLRVDDNGTGTGGAKEALIRGGEAMSDVDTFTLNPFPDATQSALTADSLVFRKSATADATTRNYQIFADDRTVILVIKSEASTWWNGPWLFGDFYSVVASDGFRSCLLGRAAENTTATTSDPFNAPLDNFANSAAGTVGHFIARSYLGVGTSIPSRRLSDAKFQGVACMSGLVKAPNAPNGGIYLSRQHFQEHTGGVFHYRGRLRGIWGWCHDTFPYADGDTISGVGELAGKTFQLINPIAGAGSVNTIAIETSDTLETN